MLITIEGTDGSGKTTQFELLARRLKKNGARVRTISFPRHAHPAAWIIEQYLHGKYGPPETLNPQASSILFALDRFDASDKLRSWLKEGCAIVASRYITSGLVYAAAKARPSQRRALWKWAEHLEYKIFGIPMADHTIILAVPTEVSQALLRRRAKTTKQRMDHLERNRSHQNEIFNIYQQLAATSKRRITLIDCAPQGNLLTKQEIHEKIWAVVRQKLVAGK